MCISVSQLVGKSGIAVFSGRAVFTHLRSLDIITGKSGHATLFSYGEQRESSVGSWMENFVLPLLPVCGIYMCHTFIPGIA